MAQQQTDRRGVRRDGRPSLTVPGMLLGIGLGGFVDGIVLHQILQWHHMVSEPYPPNTLDNTRLNVMLDGFFHTFTWLAVAAGLALLWRAVRAGRRWTWRTLLGWMLVGWGVFNVVEGTVNHHLLQLHRVRPDAASPLTWDLGFLVFGVLLIVGGWLLVRRDGATTTDGAGTDGAGTDGAGTDGAGTSGAGTDGAGAGGATRPPSDRWLG
jgi:uncharacterized membrane protein